MTLFEVSVIFWFVDSPHGITIYLGFGAPMVSRFSLHLSVRLIVLGSYKFPRVMLSLSLLLLVAV